MLITSLILQLLSSAITQQRDKSILYSRVSVILLTYVIFKSYFCLFFEEINKGISLFTGLFQTTSNTLVFHIFIFILAVLILGLTSTYPRKILGNKNSSLENIKTDTNMFKIKVLNITMEQYKIIEYSLIILFIITGSVLLISNNDIVSIFLSIELQSYGLYLLCTLYRNSELATSGGLTYFLLGGLSSCFILLGLSLLYSNSGITNLDNLYIITNISEIISINNLHSFIWYKPYYIHFSLLIMSVGFLFKISAAPFHFWAPDVYDAVPTVVTTFIAIIAKISILIFFLELINYTSKSLLDFNLNWTLNLLVSSFLSLIIGTIVGLTQSRIKRLFTYSTISHLGFMLLALSIYSIESIQAFVFYLMQYSISNLNAFIILISIGYSLYFYSNDNKEYNNLLDKNNSPIQLISQLKGYFNINPFISLSLAITLFSFVGIPPLIGFFAKQMVLTAAIDNGYIFMCLTAILTSVISAVYYLLIIKQIFFDKNEYKFNINSHKNLNSDNINDNIVLSSFLTITISILTFIILLFIYIPQEWLNMANILAVINFNL